MKQILEHITNFFTSTISRNGIVIFCSGRINRDSGVGFVSNGSDEIV